METLKLGQLITEPQSRDAVHIAVAPVVAAERLKPGQRIGFDDPGFKVRARLDGIGIVDPFLTADVEPEQQFWLWLDPGSVTGLRHDWSHPAFTKEPDKAKSETWLKSYAIIHNPYVDSPDEAFEKLIEGLKSRELFFDGSNLHGIYDLDDAWDLKEHAERYLGIKIDFDNFSFSCSC